MASFLSKPQQFTPFIPSVDVESYDRTAQTYAQAGMMRQQQYDSNIQKVQGVIDNVAGLEVANDADRVYLQNKMGELRNQISGLVGSDFAKNEVVNQAGGFAAQIYRDPTIQNAVMSANNLKKYQASKAQAKKDGKTSMTNDYYTDRLVNQWMASTEAGNLLPTMEYKEYFDDVKGFQDYIKDIDPTITVEVNPISRNADGSPNWSAYALREGKRTEISKDEIMRQAELYYGANPLAAQQLEVNSTYYADHTSDAELYSSYRQSIQGKEQVYNNKIAQLEESKKIRNGNTKDIDDQISYLQTQKDTFLKNANTLLSSASTTALKKRMYAENLFTGLADRFDRLEIDTKYVSNPIFQGQMEEAKFQQQKEEFQWSKETWGKEFQLKQQELALKAAEVAAKDGTNSIIVNPPESVNVTAEDVVNRVDMLGQQAVSDAKQMLSYAGIDYQGLSDDQVISKIEQLKDEYQSNPLQTNVNLREYFSNTTNTNNGYGKLLDYTYKRGLVNRAQESINNSVYTQQYQEQLGSLGQPNQVIGRIPIWGAPSSNDGRRFTNTNQGRVTGYRDITLGEYAEMTRVGKANQVPGGVIWTNTDLKRKVDNINTNYSKPVTEIKNREYRKIYDATPTVSQIYNTKGTEDAKQGQAVLNAVQIFAESLPDGKIRESLNSVMSDGDDGFTVAGTKDGLMGGTTVVVRNIKTGATSMPIPLPAGNERLFAGINQSDPLSLPREELKFSNQTANWYTPIDFNKGNGYNLNRYKVRGKISKTVGGSYYVDMQYKDDRTDWHNFRQTDPVNTMEEAIQQLVNTGSLDDNTLESKYIR